MKVLLVLKASVMNERHGVMHLSASLKREGHDVRLVLAERLGPEGLKAVIREYAPGVVGYSAMTGEHLGFLELNKELKKELDFVSVAGGPHATFFTGLINEEGLDAICVGEGDLAFPEFVKRLEDGGNYWETPNFYCKRGGTLYKNPPMPLAEDLDALPFPDREIMYGANPELLESDIKNFFSSRGCPYRCTYCFNREYNNIYAGKGKVVRYRSPENLVEEIARVRDRYPMKVVWFGDDAFLLKPSEWFGRFAELYGERVALPFICNVRANQVRQDTISLLRRVGLHAVWMGVECGDEKVANEVLDRGLSNAQILKAAAIFKDAGVRLVTQNLTGLPVDGSYSVDEKTMELNLAMKPAFAWSSLLYPYPGTKIEAYARSHGFLKGEAPFLETNKDRSVLDFGSALARRKIENFHKLFGLFVRFPFMRHLRGVLCVLPLTRLYLALFYIWYGYNMKVTMIPSGSLVRGTGNYFRLWWRFLRK